MKSLRIHLQPGFILHTKHYQETSLLIQLLTRDYGKIGLIAKGVRSRTSKWGTILQPFTPLLFSFSGKGSLYTLQAAEAAAPLYPLHGDTLLSAFYLNELLYKLLPEQEKYEEVFSAYGETMSLLTQEPDSMAWYLRLFEKNLLVQLGYGIDLTTDANGAHISAALAYSYEFGRGFLPQLPDHGPGYAGSSLIALRSQTSHNNPTILLDLKRLMQHIINILLEQRSVKSRELFHVPQLDYSNDRSRA